MTSYIYKAYDGKGKTVTGSIEATGRSEAVQRLKGAGLHPFDISEATPRGLGLFEKKVGTQELALFTRQLATLLAAGSTLAEALLVLKENTQDRKLKNVLLKTRQSLIEGASFSKALEPHSDVFSAFYRGIVASGEASGSLDKVLPRLADNLEARAKIINEVRAALVYPALMVLVGIGVLSFLFIFVIPKITRMFEDTGSTLPLITLALIGLSNVINRFWPVILALSGGSAWLVWRFSGTRRGKKLIDSWLLKTPLLGRLANLFYLSNMARTLGSLLKGGVGILKALEITKEVIAHSVYDEVLDEAARDCMGGGSLHSSFGKREIIPPLMTHMVMIGEKSGSLDAMLLRAADSFESEFQGSVKTSLSLLEPVLILLMGLTVGLFVLAILLPIFELNQIIR